jgi:hypothetical protein
MRCASACWVCQADAAPGALLTLCTITVWMKLVSYAHCHYDLRAAHRGGLLKPGERGAPGDDELRGVARRWCGSTAAAVICQESAFTACDYSSGGPTAAAPSA